MESHIYIYLLLTRHSMAQLRNSMAQLICNQIHYQKMYKTTVPNSKHPRQHVFLWRPGNETNVLGTTICKWIQPPNDHILQYNIIVSCGVALGNLKERMRGQGVAGKNELPVAWQARREGSVTTTEKKERMAWGRMGEERRLEHIMISHGSCLAAAPLCCHTPSYGGGQGDLCTDAFSRWCVRPCTMAGWTCKAFFSQA